VARTATESGAAAAAHRFDAGCALGDRSRHVSLANTATQAHDHLEIDNTFQKWPRQEGCDFAKLLSGYR
jgi:hypothetical protein